MGVRVVHTIGDLERDLRTIAKRAPVELRKVVRKNAIEGNRLARSYARGASGPHGKNYYKRISWDQPRSFYGFGGGSITAEYGPHGAVVGRAVGAGYRGANENSDLNRSANVIAWTFGPNALHAAHKLFWPES